MESKRQKTILIIQDISCVGRCSMQVVLPVLAASGLRCAMLPTALFSTHTGGFGQVHRLDLLKDMEGIINHWQRLGLAFDAVYTGYLGAAAQAELVLSFLAQLMAPEGKLYVDPVMADQGKPYAFCGDDMVAGLKALCQRADVIFPNRTEAALLLGRQIIAGFEPEVPDQAQVLSLGAPQAVLTGVISQEGQIGVTAYSAGQEPKTLLHKRYPGSYPGTGDMLASAVIAGLMREHMLESACALALDFIDAAFAAAVSRPLPARYGLPFELALPGFIRALGG
ncbi:MAG: pyridoxamine kinase [Eubacteriales bacterium]|nr:pyridoxamine kinase [Eubacteriales bacterium]MDD3571830.1 pyridoxamine kinase [Eubacteriales bacterium]MDD4133484.1 pyridoxamine kinase [Eubacteriales bacterium]